MGGRAGRLSVFFCILFYLANSQPSSLNFQIGDEYQYVLNAGLDTKGLDVTTNSRTSGSWGTMGSTVVIKCVDQDDTSYTFAMNMWNTEVNVGQGESVRTAPPQLLGDWLGDDMYFQQAKTGEILQIWYQDGDSPYFIEVKVGAINAFQTRIVPVSASQSFQEVDPVGKHTAEFYGFLGASNSLIVNKTFTQLNVESYPDATLHNSNINLNAVTSTTVHASGFIQDSVVSQMVNLVNIVEQSSEVSEDQGGDSSSTALNVQFSSYGTLQIAIATNSVKTAKLRSTNTKKSLTASNGFISGNLFEVASHLLLKKSNMKFSKNFHSIDRMISEFITTQDAHKLTRMYPRFARYLTKNPEGLKVLKSRMEPLIGDNNAGQLRDKFFYLLTQVETVQSQEMIVFYLNSQVENFQVEMLRHVQFMKNPTIELVNLIIELVDNENSLITVKQASLVAIGSMSRRFHDNQIRNKLAKYLMSSMAKYIKNEELLTYTIHAINNAGPTVVSVGNYGNLALNLLGHPSRRVRSAVRNSLEKFPEVTMATTVSISDSNFPFNKSYNFDYKLGGATVNADFDVELFAGSNFDCHETSFNYEALASATATLNMWSWSKQAFLAEAIYGQANGQVVGNEILVKAFDDVIYDKTLPTIDCQQHTYEIYHTAPGFSVSYTLWVAVIPVVFTASADLQFDLSWGYDVCINELSAMVELVPSASLVLSGDAEVDLLIIKAGIQLDGSFNTQLIPQLYVHGTQCEVGVDVNRVSQPMNIDLTAYYAWKDCKLWIFDCHWGQHDSVNLFSWDYPAVNQVIMNQDWQIQL